MGREWSASEDALLGTDADERIAARIGVSKQAVYLRRKALGVAPSRARRADVCSACGMAGHRMGSCPSTPAEELSPSQRAARRYLDGGVTLEAAGSAHGVSRQAVAHALRSARRTIST